MKILFAAGGSIGHIAPCIAVWRAVQKIEPAAEAHFVCSTRPEDQAFLTKESVMFAALGGRNIHLWTLPMTFLRAWQLLSYEKPSIIFTKGGGVTIPLALAGWVKRIPIVVHESDAIDGRATRFISRFAVKVIRDFPCNPLRPEFMKGSRERGLQLTGLSGSRPILLVMGGSQGATVLNDAVKNTLNALLKIVDVIHITGAGKRGAGAVPGKYWTCPFAYDDYAHLVAVVDMAMCRAGAGTISELVARKIPAILVPLRGLAHDHQEHNARWLKKKNACVVLEQEDLATRLLATVEMLSSDASSAQSLRQAMESLPGLDASTKAADILLAIA